LDRFTKALVAISALAALAFETIQANRYQNGILALCVLASLVGWLAGRRWPDGAP
jgi:hypothetical protein